MTEGNESVMRRVRASTLRKQVADALREAILSGELRPGERLREMDLAQRFGVSRNPVREAIGELEQQGLVEYLPNQGTAVVSPTPAELRQAYEVRITLEKLALRLGWQALSGDRLEQLRGIVDQMKRLKEERGLSPAERHGRMNLLDARFHSELIRAAGSSTLERAWQAASPWALAFVSDLEHAVESVERQVGPDPHEALLEALRRRDLEDAERILAAHAWRPWLDEPNMRREYNGEGERCRELKR